MGRDESVTHKRKMTREGRERENREPESKGVRGKGKERKRLVYRT